MIKYEQWKVGSEKIKHVFKRMKEKIMGKCVNLELYGRLLHDKNIE